MFRFEKLDVWRLANEYCNKLFQLTRTFPKEELFRLTSQLDRAGISIPSNIAEGSGATTINDFCHYLDISIKSAIETVSQLFIAEKRGYIDASTKELMYAEAEILVKKIQSLKKSLRNPEQRATSYEQRAQQEVSNV